MKRDKKAPRVRPGWIELEQGHWLRTSTVVAVEAENLPEPERPDPDADCGITALTAAGREWHSVYTTGAVLDALAAAEGMGIVTSPPERSTAMAPNVLHVDAEGGVSTLINLAVVATVAYAPSRRMEPDADHDGPWDSGSTLILTLAGVKAKGYREIRFWGAEAERMARALGAEHAGTPGARLETWKTEGVTP